MLQLQKQNAIHFTMNTYIKFYHCNSIRLKEEGTRYAHASDENAKIWSYLSWMPNGKLSLDKIVTVKGTTEKLQN